MTDTSITTFKQAEERLAASLPGYESRPQQQALAEAIEVAIAEGTNLVSQAGCGTGKSFATSIPAITSRKRTVISTATKALQDQVANKDLPFLHEHLGVDFTYAILKGRSNYLCLAQAYADESESIVNIGTVRDRAGDPAAFSGERDDLGVDIEDRDWRKLTVSSEECPGAKQCPFGGECYAERAKRRAQEANVVVVNHALLLTDTMVKMVTDGFANMLGTYDVLIIDEAHEFEEYAVSAFSTRTTQAGLLALATEVRNWVLKYDLDGEVIDLVNKMLGAVSALWDVLEPGRVRQATVMENEDAWADMAITLNDLHARMITVDLGHVGDYEKARSRKEILSRRTERLAQTFVDIATSSDDDLVRWVEDETTFRGETRRTIKAAPIDVAPILRSTLFNGEVPAILVSATIAVGDSFDYITGRLGVDEYTGLDVGTPFDFKAQARTYIPRTIPAPAGSTKEAWSSISAVEMLDLVRASQGRALLLFTSNKEMRSVYEAIAARIESDGINVYMQGQDGPNKVLAERFKEDISSVLFATRSFFTGVDFPGETLSLVVINKLPFPVPTEPMVEARTELIERRGGSSFKDYVIPTMALVLAQGFGRLIRTVNDRGVVAILDPRLVTKGYGAKILRALPDSPIIETLPEVTDFFAEEA